MKKLLFIVGLFFSINSLAQFPINATTGTPTTTVLTRGVAAADSAYQFRTNFADTTAANRGRVDELPGATIRTGSTIWLRNQTATAWISISNSSNASITNIYNNSIVTYVLLNGDSCVVPTTGGGLAIDTICFNFVVCSVTFLTDSTFLACPCDTTIALCDTASFTPTPLYIFQNGVAQTAPGVVEWGTNPLIHNTTIGQGGYDVTFTQRNTGAFYIHNIGTFKPADFILSDDNGGGVWIKSNGDIISQSPAANDIKLRGFGVTPIINLASKYYGGIEINPQGDGNSYFLAKTLTKDSMFYVDAANDRIRMDVGASAGTSDSALVVDPITKTVTMKAVGGSSGERFGVSGEDDSYTANRYNSAHGTWGHLLDSLSYFVLDHNTSFQVFNEAEQLVLDLDDASGISSVYSGDGSRSFRLANTSVSLTGLTNLATQDRILGQFSSDNTLGYITVGSGLSLSSGVLSATGGGTVTSFAFTDGSGFDGTVTNATTTPTLSLTTTVTNTQVMFSNSGAIAGDADFTFNGTQVIVPATTGATTPSIAMTGVTNTGLEFHGVTDGVSFNINGARRFAVTSTQIRTDAGGQFSFNNTGTGAYGGGATVGLGWQASGVARITNGSTGYGDLMLNDLLVVGTSSGTITIQPQAAAGTFNFNLPTTAGTSGYLLTSGGGGATAMTWTDPATIGSITADNGLTENVANNVRLGGTLAANTTIATTSSFFLLVSGNNTSNGSFQATNTSSGIGITGNSTSSGTGGYFWSSSGTGAQVEGAIGLSAVGTTALTALSTATSGLAGAFEINPTANNTSLQVVQINRFTQGTAAAGIGGFIRYSLENGSNQTVESGRIGVSLTTVTAASEVSQMDFSTISNGAASISSKLTITGAGSIIINAGSLLQRQGADVASVAGAITLGSDGNVFELTGTNAVTLISNLNWQNGSEITLLFTSTASLTDGTANSGTDIGMELAGNTNFTGSAGASITLVLSEISSTQRWREKCRSVN